jgi:hypothetical protein
LTKLSRYCLKSGEEADTREAVASEANAKRDNAKEAAGTAEVQAAGFSDLVGLKKND